MSQRRSGRGGLGVLPLLCVVLLARAEPCAAQSWVPVGPPGGDVRSLASDPRDPRLVYLGTADGVLYRSADGGARWSRMSPGFPLRGRSLDDIVVEPSGAVLVGYWEVAGGGGGVARSSDGGRSFSFLPGIEGQSVRALALAPSDPRVLTVGALSGVFRSPDGGRSWRRISPEGHAELRNVGSLAVDPRDPDVVYAGTWHLAWKTLDGGRSWRQVPLGMIADSDVMTLTIAPGDPATLYATACTGIYRSRDGAQRWLKLKGIPAESRRTRAFALDPARPDTLYAGTTQGLWISEDGAGSWRLATPRNLVVNAVLPRPDGSLLLGSEGAGVLVSRDQGRSWSASNDGFSERMVSRIVFDDKGRALAGILGDRQHGGVLAAASISGPWRRLGTGLEGREVLSLGFASRPLAGTDDGVFAWSDAQAAWTRLGITSGGVELHPRVADMLVLPSGTLLAASSQGVLRSADGGASWSRVLLGTARAVSAIGGLPGVPEGALAATTLGFFETRDAGASWTQVAAGLHEITIHALAPQPGSRSVIFAASSRGLLRSNDGGRRWSRCSGLPHSDITGLAFAPGGRTLFATDFSRGGIFRSDDGGETWTLVPSDGLVSDRVWSLAVEPGAGGRLVAASSSGGLHVLAPAEAPAAAGSR
jgi:photosystem II stability/assembly factor-like uncharacterized protein